VYNVFCHPDLLWRGVTSLCPTQNWGTSPCLPSATTYPIYFVTLHICVLSIRNLKTQHAAITRVYYETLSLYFKFIWKRGINEVSLVEVRLVPVYVRPFLKHIFHSLSK
jgi:hypothetical protein